MPLPTKNNVVSIGPKCDGSYSNLIILPLCLGTAFFNNKN